MEKAMSFTFKDTGFDIMVVGTVKDMMQETFEDHLVVKVSFDTDKREACFRFERADGMVLSENNKEVAKHWCDQLRDLREIGYLEKKEETVC